jgi:hypothetical protein
MKSVFSSSAIASAFAASASTLLWVQHEDTAVYTSAGLSRHAGSTPTFATATWLNSPIYVESYNVSDNGQNVWAFQSSLPLSDLATFQVDMARHAVTFGVSGVVDTVAAQANFVPPSACNIYAFNSRGTSVPLWSINVSNCDSELLYDDDRYIDISDDGSTVAFSGFVTNGATTTGQMWVIDAQTGTVKFSKTNANGGPVQLSENGTYIAWTVQDSVNVYSTSDGSLRDSINMNWNTQAELSDSGDYLAFAGDDAGYIYSWDATNNQYKLAYTVVPPNGGTWYSVSCAISSDGSGTNEGELVTFSFIDGQALTARILIYSMVNGQLLTDYTTPKNAQLQTNPTVRMDRNYAGVCLWGDNNDVPTAIVLQAGSNNPVFAYTTPGSMFGVDIVVDPLASTPTQDVLYFSVAGKHTPANVMGNGGDAYSWKITVPK